MKKFPLPLHRWRAGMVILDDAQKEWFCKVFPVVENCRIAKAMGVSLETVRRLKNELGLEKSEEGRKAIEKRRAKRASRTCEKNGCYDRKRGHAPSKETMEGIQRRWQKIREGKMLDPVAVFKQRDPQGFEAMKEKRNAKRRETVRKEKLRVLYGLGRKTKLKCVVLTPYTQSQTHHRCAALKRGYLLDVDCSEGTEGRYTIYYDDDTERSAKFEDNCRKDGFSFVRDEG